MSNYRASIVLMFVLIAPAISLFAETAPQMPTVELRGDSAVAGGGTFTVSIFLTDSSKTIGGFDFLIEFDNGAIVFDSATYGAHTAGQWEYFTSRSALLAPENSTSTAAFMRVLGIADNQDAAKKHPDPKSLVGPGELVRLYLYATDRKEYVGKVSELRFLWNKCSDNSISDLTGNQLLLAAKVTDASGILITAERYAGPARK
ncbi:MAG: hypothetical protein WBP42_04740, partial [Candidatus Zixiibacteriota bacterium]